MIFLMEEYLLVIGHRKHFQYVAANDAIRDVNAGKKLQMIDEDKKCQ